jgi:hypothetical protein
MLRKQADQRLSQILEEMPPVGNLNGIGSNLMCPFSVRTCSIAANELDSRMLLQPGAQRLGCALRQELNRAVVIKVDQDGAIGLAFAEGEIVDTKMLRGWNSLVWDGADSAQERVTTGWLVDLSCDAGTSGSP